MKKILQSVVEKVPKSVPNLPEKITKDDVYEAEEAVRKNMTKKIQVNMLRLILAECYEKIGNPDFIKPLLDISLPQIQHTQFVHEAMLRIADGIIKADQVMRAHTVQNYLKKLQVLNDTSLQMKAKLQIIRSGLHCLSNNFLKAANKSFSASKQSFYADKFDEKLKLIQKTIAYAFISEKNAEQHQLVCSLYVNQIAKKSKLYCILIKLYNEQMLDMKEIEPLKCLLPDRISQKDTDNVSIISKAIFAHNMLSILKSFSCISIKTVCELIGVNKDQMLLMIQKTYRKGEVTVDLVDQYIEIADQEQQQNLLVKKWFEKIDDVLAAYDNADQKKIK